MRAVLALSLLALQVSPALADAPARIAGGNLYAPRFSPDGSALLVTGERMHGLSVVDIDSGAVRAINDDARAGVTARYLSDGRVVFEARRAGAARTVAIDADGALAKLDVPAPVAFAHDDRIYVRTAAGVVSVGTGDRFFGVRISPDNARVAFVGLATGVYVYDIASATLDPLGPGTAPAWSPDSTRVAFERTEDDGHVIVGSDIWIWQAGAATTALTATDREIERRPSWSPDGSRIAYDDDRGAVYVMTVEVQQ